MLSFVVDITCSGSLPPCGTRHGEDQQMDRCLGSRRGKFAGIFKISVNVAAYALENVS